MVDYVGQKMIVDTRRADGGAYFEKDKLVWKARSLSDSKYNVSIRYEDIEELCIIMGTKKRVDVVTKDKKIYSFFLYKADTFVELINAGREAVKKRAEDGFTPMSTEDVDQLFKITELHKAGVLSDEQFEIQKNSIMSKYQ